MVYLLKLIFHDHCQIFLYHLYNYYKGIKNWRDVTEKIFNGNATFISLTQSYRSTVEIIEFAKHALEAQNLGITPAKPVLRHGDNPIVKVSRDKKESAKFIEQIIEEIEGKGKRSIGIACCFYGFHIEYRGFNRWKIGFSV